jgi:hypothetical protein
MSLCSVPLLRKALRAASGDTSSSSSSIWACDLDALCRSEAYDSPSSSRSSPGAKMSDSKSCSSTSSQDSERPGRERLDRGMVGAGVLERRRAGGGQQGVSFECTGMCQGGRGVCLVRQLQRPAAVFCRARICFLLRRWKQDWSGADEALLNNKQASKQASSDLLLHGGARRIHVRRVPVASKSGICPMTYLLAQGVSRGLASCGKGKGTHTSQPALCTSVECSLRTNNVSSCASILPLQPRLRICMYM